MIYFKNGDEITKDNAPEEGSIFILVNVVKDDNGNIIKSVGETWHITKIRDYLSLLEQ